MKSITKIPIDGVLDLHTFSPKEVKSLVPYYLKFCRKKGILGVRIIHGKGTGTLLRTVHKILSRLEYVEDFRLAPYQLGGWGATIVKLKPMDKYLKK